MGREDVNTYYSNGSVVGTQPFNVGPLQRGTGSPGAVGLHQQVAIKVTSDLGIVVERPMYFNDNIPTAGGWTTGASSAVGATSLGPNGKSTAGSDWFGSSHISGGTDVVGEAGSSSQQVYTFAEGYTNTNFSEFLTLQNPNNAVEMVAITLFADNTIVQQMRQLPPHSRTTVNINSLVVPMANAYPANPFAHGFEVSMTIQVFSGTVVAERPLYFIFHGEPGGTDVIGYTGG